MKRMKFFGAFLVFLVLAFTCSNKNNTVQKAENIVTKSSAEKEQDRILEDEILRKKYTYEISLTNDLINLLEDYRSQNSSYPHPVDFIFEDLEKEISNTSGKNFYYTWLDQHYVLTYELPDGTGLIYFSKSKSWRISEYLP
jgi:hypothetical protein